MKIQRFEGVEDYGDRTLHLGGYSEKKQTYRSIKLLILSVLCLCVLAALQTTLLSRLPVPLLSPGAPSLCLLFTLAAGYVFGEKEGGVCGFAGGIAFECITMEPLFGGITVWPLIYGILGYVTGALSKKVLAGNLPSFLVYAAVGALAEVGCLTAITCLHLGYFPPAPYFLQGSLPGLIWTLLLSPLMYLLLWAGKRLFDRNI